MNRPVWSVHVSYIPYMSYIPLAKNAGNNIKREETYSSDEVMSFLFSCFFPRFMLFPTFLDIDIDI